MGDTTEETTQDETVDTSDESVDETEESTTEDESDTSTDDGENTDDEESGDESDDDSGSDDDGEDGDGKGDSDEETDTAEDDTEEFTDDGDEPELRKPKAGAPNSEWAAWRAQEKAKKKESGDSTESEKDDDAEDSDDADISDEDAAAVRKIVDKELAPIRKQAAEQEVETEIASFLKDNPDFKPFEAKVKRWANHPNRSGVPVKSIFYEVAGPSLMKIGAQRAKAADKKANKTKTAGGNTSQQTGSKSYADMSLNDFGKELEAEKLKR